MGKKRDKNSVVTVLVYGDIHAPYHDKECIELLVKFAKDLQPDRIVDLGDSVDCKSISKYKELHDPRQMPSLLEECDIAKEIVARISEACPDALKFKIDGNHEYRAARLIYKYPELFGLIDMRSLLGLDTYGWKCKPYGKYWTYKNFVFTHGKLFRKHSAYTAKAMVEEFQTSGMSGHTHRAGASYRNAYGGAVGWWEGGCLCSFSLAYEWFQNPHPNWQHAVSVISFFDDNKFHVDQIIIPSPHKFIFFQGRYYTL